MFTKHDISIVGNSTNFPNTIFPHIFDLLTLIHSAMALIQRWVSVTWESLN